MDIEIKIKVIIIYRRLDFHDNGKIDKVFIESKGVRNSIIFFQKDDLKRILPHIKYRGKFYPIHSNNELKIIAESKIFNFSVESDFLVYPFILLDESFPDEYGFEKASTISSNISNLLYDTPRPSKSRFLYRDRYDFFVITVIFGETTYYNIEGTKQRDAVWKSRESSVKYMKYNNSYCPIHDGYELFIIQSLSNFYDLRYPSYSRFIKKSLLLEGKIFKNSFDIENTIFIIDEYK